MHRLVSWQLFTFHNRIKRSGVFLVQRNVLARDRRALAVNRLKEKKNKNKEPTIILPQQFAIYPQTPATQTTEE